MKITYSENNTHVEDSYTTDNYNLNVCYIIRERTLRKLKVTRSFESYVREWRGHNRLYERGIKQDHTKSVDLEEPQSLFWRIVWLIIGR